MDSRAVLECQFISRSKSGTVWAEILVRKPDTEKAFCKVKLNTESIPLTDPGALRDIAAAFEAAARAMEGAG